METNVILKYRRGSDSWLCPECDTENGIAYGECALCGNKRSPAAAVLRQWTEADERPVVPQPVPAKPSVSTAFPVFRDTEGSHTPAKSDGNKTALVCAIFIVVIIAVILFIIANS